MRCDLTDRQTDRPNYSNPRCACAPRVNKEEKQLGIAIINLVHTSAIQASLCIFPADVTVKHLDLLVLVFTASTKKLSKSPLMMNCSDSSSEEDQGASLVTLDSR